MVQLYEWEPPSGFLRWTGSCPITRYHRLGAICFITAISHRSLDQKLKQREGGFNGDVGQTARSVNQTKSSPVYLINNRRCTMQPIAAYSAY